MAIQLAVATRNTRLDAIDTAVGATATLEIRTGAQPANCAAADSGSVLVTITLPNPAFGAADAGVLSKNGTWAGTATGAGTAAHFRIKAAGTTTIVQGSVGEGSGDIDLDNTDIAIDQVVTVTSAAITSGNA